MGSNEKKIERYEQKKYQPEIQRSIVPFPNYHNMTSSNKDFIYENPILTRPSWIKRTISYN